MSDCAVFVAETTKELASDKAHRRHRRFPEIESLETRITPSKLTLLPASLPNLTVGQKSQVEFTARNGDGHYRYRLISGALPTGLALGTNGLFSGEARVAGTYSFAIRVTDPTRGGKSATRPFSLTVKCDGSGRIDNDGVGDPVRNHCPCRRTRGRHFLHQRDRQELRGHDDDQATAAA